MDGLEAPGHPDLGHGGANGAAPSDRRMSDVPSTERQMIVTAGPSHRGGGGGGGRAEGSGSQPAIHFHPNLERLARARDHSSVPLGLRGLYNLGEPLNNATRSCALRTVCCVLLRFMSRPYTNKTTRAGAVHVQPRFCFGFSSPTNPCVPHFLLPPQATPAS